MSSILVVGSGGREHAIVEALARAPAGPSILAAPGNPGMCEVATLVPIPANDVAALTRCAVDRRVDLVVVGPEVPLVLGLADRLDAAGIPVFGPTAAAACLEGSKAFAKAVMEEAAVPTARWGVFRDAEEAIAFARTLGGAPVVKADGLAAGKGVFVPKDMKGSEEAIQSILRGAFGEAGHQVVVEEQLEGEELSVMALSDGERVAVLAPSQDHKRLLDGDTGPNTGGMGAYSPPTIATNALLDEIRRCCLEPVVALMRRRGTPFRGVLYAGVMVTATGPKILEFNVRFGDPETQALLPRLESDPFELFRDVALGRLDTGRVTFSSSSSLVVVLATSGYPTEPRLGDVIEGLEEARQIPGVRVYHAGTRSDGSVLRTAGGRVLGVTGLGPDLPTAARCAYEGVARIRFTGMQYRTDIGARSMPAPGRGVR